MRFLIGLIAGALIGAVLTILATGDAGQALQAQVRDRAARERTNETPAATGRTDPSPRST